MSLGIAGYRLVVNSLGRPVPYSLGWRFAVVGDATVFKLMPTVYAKQSAVSGAQAPTQNITVWTNASPIRISNHALALGYFCLFVTKPKKG